MSGGVDLTEALLKSTCKSFDTEAIFSANLSNLNLRKLHLCLNTCASLCMLDLSGNALGSTALVVLSGPHLPKLRMLNLSRNKLDSLAAFPSLAGLENLNLEGNGIGEVNGAGGIEALVVKCPALRTLSLKSLGSGGGSQQQQLSNPVCSLPSYRTNVLALFGSRLHALDGIRVGASFYEEQEALLASTAQYATGAAPSNAPAHNELPPVARAVEDWFPTTGSWPVILPADVEQDLAPRVTSVKQTLKECARILAEECDQHLAECEKRYPPTTGEKTAAMQQAASTRNSSAGKSNGASTFGFGDAED